ncbi:MAG: hypothetical protein AB1921_15905 [Thermodesulfobacteriota bacterium]
MVRKAAVLLVAVVCLIGFMGCKEEGPTAEQQAQIAKIRQSVNDLKTQKEEIDQTLQQLNRQLAKINLDIVYLDRAYEELFAPQKPAGFWEGMQLYSGQANVVILLLFVVWLFYIISRRRNCKRD